MNMRRRLADLDGELTEIDLEKTKVEENIMDKIDN